MIPISKEVLDKEIFSRKRELEGQISSAAMPLKKARNIRDDTNWIIGGGVSSTNELPPLSATSAIEVLSSAVTTHEGKHVEETGETLITDDGTKPFWKIVKETINSKISHSKKAAGGLIGKYPYDGPMVYPPPLSSVNLLSGTVSRNPVYVCAFEYMYPSYFTTGTPACPTCKDSSKVHTKGWNTPRTVIIDGGSCDIIGFRYLCNICKEYNRALSRKPEPGEKKRKTTFNSYDAVVLDLMPGYIRETFPFFLTKKSGINLGLLNSVPKTKQLINPEKINSVAYGQQMNTNGVMNSEQVMMHIPGSSNPSTEVRENNSSVPMIRIDYYSKKFYKEPQNTVVGPEPDAVNLQLLSASGSRAEVPLPSVPAPVPVIMHDLGGIAAIPGRL